MLYDPERRWIDNARCADPKVRDEFFADTSPGRPSHGVTERWNRAKEICAACPVMHQCRRDTLGETHGVWGGLDENQRAAVRRRLPRAAARWPASRRLAWGKETSRLRDGGVLWRDIARQTGLPPSLAEKLALEWTEHCAALAQVPPAVVDVHLPEEDVRGPFFPEVPGRRHAWVRHAGRISDGIYRGETPSGAYVFVTVYSGHGHVNKWVPRKDVHQYHPQPVVILTMRKEVKNAPAA